MQTTSATSTLRFEFASEGQRNALLSRLTEGQTLQAHVLDEISEGRWALRLFGHTFVAESRLNLARGQVVEARVQAFGPPLVLTISGRPGSEAEAVTTALQRLDLPSDETHRAVVAALIRQGLPVSREAVRDLTQLLQQLQQALPEVEFQELAARVLLLRARGIPVTPDAVAAFLSAAPPGSLGTLLEQIADLIKAEARRNKLDRNVTDRIERLHHGVPDTSNTTPEQLREAVRRLGLDAEYRILTGADSDDVHDTWRSALGLLKREEDDVLVPSLRNAVEAAVRALDTLRLAASPGEAREELVLQLPLAFGDERATADLRIRSQEGGSGGDPRTTSITIRISLSQLGDVSVTLSIRGSRATCRITAPDGERSQWLNQAARELEDGLRAVDLHVGRVVVRTAAIDAETAPTRVGIDLKA